ncbi:MAG: PAS domain S-box protein, partial [Candidatus Methylumidiphilus sp.]
MLNDNERILLERINIMNAVQAVSKLIRSNLDLPDFLAQVMAALPKAMLYPDDVEVDLYLGDENLQSEGFAHAQPERIVANIVTKEGFFGKITMAYRSPHPVRDIGPFRQDEQALLDEIAEMLIYFVERQKAEERLKLAAKVFECSKEGISITDAHGHIQSVNQSFTQITGYGFAEVYRQNLRILKSGKHPPEFYQDMWVQLMEKGNWSGEIWNRRKNGEVYPEWLSITQVTDKHGRLSNYIGLFMDITSLKEADERILFLAHHDPLTGLPNRTLL